METRRLAYFRLICQQAEKFLPCDITFLVDAIPSESRRMRSLLQKYRRSTGKMETRNVCYNYLDFSEYWRTASRSYQKSISPI